MVSGQFFFLRPSVILCASISIYGAASTATCAVCVASVYFLDYLSQPSGACPQQQNDNNSTLQAQIISSDERMLNEILMNPFFRECSIQVVSGTLSCIAGKKTPLRNTIEPLINIKTIRLFSRSLSAFASPSYFNFIWWLCAFPPPNPSRDCEMNIWRNIACCIYIFVFAAQFSVSSLAALAMETSSLSLSLALMKIHSRSRLTACRPFILLDRLTGRCLRNATRVGAVVVDDESRIGGVLVVGYVCGQCEVDSADAHSSSELWHVERQVAQVNRCCAAGCTGVLGNLRKQF